MACHKVLRQQLKTQVVEIECLQQRFPDFEDRITKQPKVVITRQ